MSVTYTPASIPVKASKTQPGPDSEKKEISITPPKEKEAAPTGDSGTPPGEGKEPKKAEEAKETKKGSKKA